ncbi:MAG: FAD-binding protein, partial [Parvibaculaceae bacterium]
MSTLTDHSPPSALGPSLIWRNWVSNQVSRIGHFAMPGSDEEACAIVKVAARNGLSVRVAGTGHSYTPIVATDGVVVSAERLTGIEAIDPQRGHVTLRG